jgi:CheY-like chemotaxis protein
MSGRHKPILIVDDSEEDNELILRALRSMPMDNELMVLNDGAEALDWLHRRERFASRTNSDPVLIMLDVKMPKVDGIEVLRQVKSSPTLKCIPIVMMTSSDLDRDIIESYELGANAYVVKPVEMDKFLEAVRQIAAFWVVLNRPKPD